MAAPTLVQSKTGYASPGFALDVTPTSGNLLLAVTADRGGGALTVTTAGWTKIADVTNSAGFDRGGHAYYRVADGTNPTFSADGTTNAHITTLMEWAGTYGGTFAAASEIASTTNLDCGGSVTPAAGTDVTVVGFGSIGNLDSDYPGITVAPDGSVIEVTDTSDGSGVNSPGLWVGYLPVTTAAGSYIAGGTISSAKAYCGITVLVEETAVALPVCDGPIALDVYQPGVNGAATLTYLATLCGVEDVTLRPELDGTGSIQFKINKNDADATAAILGDGDGDVRYIKARIPAIQSAPIFGGFLDEGDFSLIGNDEQGSQVLTFGGRGPLGYLDFAKMAHTSYITGGHTPYGGLWRLYLAGTGSKPGQMFRRIIEEAQDTDRPQKPLPNLTIDFDYTNDSGGGTITSSSVANPSVITMAAAHNLVTGDTVTIAGHTGSTPDINGARVVTVTGATTFTIPVNVTVGGTGGTARRAWASSSATNEFSAAILESVLSVTGRLIGTGAITVQCSPDLLLSGYNSFGTNRSNATFAAGKVRFVAGTNIGAGLDSPGPKGVQRQIRINRTATHAWVYGESEGKAVGSLSDAASRVTRETGISSYGSDATALDAVGDVFLTDQLTRSESITVPLGVLGSDEATGKYLPGPSGSSGHFWVGDTVTLHTGTGDFDYNNASHRVAAIVIHQGPAAKEVTDLDVWVELGSLALLPQSGPSGGTLVGSPGGGSTSVPAHSHPAAAVSGFLTTSDGGGDIVSTVAAAGATETLDLADGNVHDVTLTANCTFTFTGPTSGQGRWMTLALRQDATGSRLATWPGSVVWPGGVTPTLATDPNAVDWFTFLTLDGGTTWYGWHAGGGGSTSPLTTKGDLWGYSTEDARIPVGANGTVLTGDSTAALGVSYQTIEDLGHWEPLMDGGSPYEPLDDGSGTDWLFVWVP